MTEQQDHAFLVEVMTLFAQADCHSELFWTVDLPLYRPPDAVPKMWLHAIVSDVFAWGSADLEEITPDAIDVLRQAFEALKPYGLEGLSELPVLYAARVRGMRPQGAYFDYVTIPEVRQLLMDCGPQRDVSMLNPRPIKPLTTRDTEADQNPAT